MVNVFFSKMICRPTVVLYDYYRLIIIYYIMMSDADIGEDTYGSNEC